MIKALVFLTRKPGLTREQFIEYYETRHVPLILRTFPETCGYRRNFIDHDSAALYSRGNLIDCDAIAELWYPDLAAYEASTRRYAEPGVAAAVAHDEDQVFDRSKTRFVLVDERVSQIG